MHRGADDTLGREVERATPRTRARRLLRVTAVLANLALFAAGLYFEAHPRDRSDRWSAAAVAAVAVLNSAALSLPKRGRGEGPMRRLRRVALILNTLLLASATLIVALAALRDLRHAAFHGALLVVPPFVTMLALRRYPQG